jgi:hypothetical protein
MGTHIHWPIQEGVKTTVNISDSLLREARKVAARQGLTLRALIERGLHRVLSEPNREAPFKLRRASFKGKGHQPERCEDPWDSIRALAYEGRGG